MRLFSLLLWRQLTSPVQGPDDPCSGCLVLSSPSFRDHNIFFMGLPFIGSSSEAPSFSSSSSRLSSDRRSNKSFPKSPANMFPFTNADMFPNIGRIVTRGSSGKRDLKNSFDFSSGRGMITWEPRDCSSLGDRFQDVQGLSNMRGRPGLR